MSEIAADPAEHAARIKSIRAVGMGIIMGDPNTLQLDLDSKENREQACTLIHKFHDAIGISMVYETISKSGNFHFHIILKEPKERKDRIFWQCALGSDPVRELLSQVQFDQGMELESFLAEVSGAKMNLVYDFTQASKDCQMEDIPF